MSKWHGGKGHQQRPQTKQEREQYERNWDVIFNANVIVDNNHVELPEPTVDEMLSDYLDGYLIMSDDCPVTNIEAYETGKFLKSSSNCGIKCYRLAKAIMNIRKNK